MVIERAPLEDELGDVLDKAMSMAGLNETQLAEKTGINVDHLHAVIDYCEPLTDDEICRVAAVLNLKEAGLRAVASEAYPLPDICGLPFCLYPLRMRHGIGVANAYLVADCSQDWGILFDTGTGEDFLWRNWPRKIKRVAAVFLTHFETEHTGGLPAVRRRFPHAAVFGPGGEKRLEGVIVLKSGASIEENGFQVEVISTPGHVEDHHCYKVSLPQAKHGAHLLISGDLLFAGSIGGAFFCADRIAVSLGEIFRSCGEDTVVAAGHGPLTTLRNERTNNPFIGTNLGNV